MSQSPERGIDAAQDQDSDAHRGTMQRTLLLNVLIDGAGSYAVYMLLHHHTSEFKALAWSMLPPSLNTAQSLVRKRHVDIVGILVIAGLVASLGLVLLGGSPRLLLVRDSLITGLVGLVFLGSVLMRRPLLFFILRQLAATNDADAGPEWDARFQASPVGLGLPLMTAVWGLALVGEAALRTVCAMKLPIPVFLAIWPFINIGIYAGASAWTFWYGRRGLMYEDHMVAIDQRTEP